MAEQSNEALEFLEAFTEYLEWRAGRRPKPDDEMQYAVEFEPYLDRCGVTEPELRANLLKHMQGFATARGSGETQPPVERGSG